MGCTKKCRMTKRQRDNFIRELQRNGYTIAVYEKPTRAKAKRTSKRKVYLPKVSWSTKAQPRDCMRRPAPRRNKCKKKPRRRAKPRCGPKRKRCMKPGPVTNNAYLNYLRYFKRHNCGLSPKETVRKAARKWCRLPPQKKLRYRRMACKVTKNPRRLRTKLCRSVNKRKKKC